MISCLLFDLGETLTETMIDDTSPLNQLPLVAYPDALSTLALLAREGYRMALVTNTCQSGELIVREAIGKVGLAQFFSEVVTSVDVGWAKPSPAIFIRALDRLECTAREALMIGDHVVNDMEGAGALGIHTIHLARSGAPVVAPRFSPDCTVGSLSQVPGKLREMSRR